MTETHTQPIEFETKKIDFDSAYAVAMNDYELTEEWREEQVRQSLDSFLSQAEQLGIGRTEGLGIIVVCMRLVGLEHKNYWHMDILRKNIGRSESNQRLAEVRSGSTVSEQSIANHELEFTKILFQYPLASSAIRRLRSDLTNYSTPTGKPYDDAGKTLPIRREPEEAARLRAEEAMWRSFENFIEDSENGTDIQEDTSSLHDEVQTIMNVVVERHAHPWHTNPLAGLINTYSRDQVQHEALTFLENYNRNNSERDQIALQHVRQLLDGWFSDAS